MDTPETGTLEARVWAVLAGAAVGDALGGATEGWTPEQIQARHGGPVTGIVGPYYADWRNARPIVAFARFPEPNTLQPAFMPIALRIGPFTTSSGLAMCVVACTPFKLNGGAQSASIAASTTGA